MSDPLTPEQMTEIRRRADENYRRNVAAHVGLILSLVAACGLAVAAVVVALQFLGVVR